MFPQLLAFWFKICHPVGKRWNSQCDFIDFFIDVWTSPRNCANTAMWWCVIQIEATWFPCMCLTIIRQWCMQIFFHVMEHRHTNKFVGCCGSPKSKKITEHQGVVVVTPNHMWIQMCMFPKVVSSASLVLLWWCRGPVLWCLFWPKFLANVRLLGVHPKLPTHAPILLLKSALVTWHCWKGSPLVNNVKDGCRFHQNPPIAQEVFRLWNPRGLKPQGKSISGSLVAQGSLRRMCTEKRRNRSERWKTQRGGTFYMFLNALVLLKPWSKKLFPGVLGSFVTIYTKNRQKHWKKRSFLKYFFWSANYCGNSDLNCSFACLVCFWCLVIV